MTATEPKYDSGNVMEFRTTQCKPCRVLFDALKENITDASIYFSSEGMKIYSLDNGQTVLINVELEADNFDHYYCRKETNEDGQEVPIEICVSVHNINKVLKTISPEDDVLIWTYNPQNEFITIVINSSTKNETRSYEIKLQDPDDNDEAGVVDDVSKYQYVLTMPCNDFQRICRDLKGMNVSAVTITYQDNCLSFASKSDVAKSSIVRQGSQGDEKEENETNVVFCRLPEGKSCYTGEFKFESLYNFSKCASIGSKSGKVVKIYLSDDDPIVLVFNVGKLGKILFVLAPLEKEDS